jgi:Uma2 family endonuclease
MPYTFAMTALATKTYTHAEALKLEQQTGTRFELVDGKLFAMAGETRAHNLIAGNIYTTLRLKARAKGCEISMENVKVRTLGAKYRYPDVVLSCAPGEDPYFLENPCLIVEVLSETTAATDSTNKLEEYLQIPSLECYMLVEQDPKRVIVYERQDGKWFVRILEQEGEVAVPCIEATLSLADIYST